MNDLEICLFYVDRSYLRLSQIMHIFSSYSFYQQSEISGTTKKTISPSSWQRWETSTKKLKGMLPVRDFVSFKLARADFFDETNSKARSIFAYFSVRWSCSCRLILTKCYHEWILNLNKFLGIRNLNPVFFFFFFERKIGDLNPVIFFRKK